MWLAALSVSLGQRWITAIYWHLRRVMGWHEQDAMVNAWPVG